MKVINSRGPSAMLDDLARIGKADLVPVRKRYRDACQACLDVCNRPAAVAALSEHYAEEAVARDIVARQFLKMVEDKKGVDRARAVRRPEDSAHAAAAGHAPAAE